MNKKILAIFFASGVLFSGCADEENVAEKSQLVKVEEVKFSSDERTANYSGVVKGRYETNMSFQVGGKIISRNVQVGDGVTVGTPLMTIDPKDVSEQSRASEAEVSSAQAQLNLAKSNFERYSQLYKDEAISAATLDQYKTQYDAAIAAHKAAVAQAQQRNNALDYTNLTADSDGVISSITAEVGQVVAAGQTVLTFVRTNELEVSADIPENKISSLNIGDPVIVNFWAFEGTFEGTLREISPMADSGSRTFNVKISLPAPPKNLKLGMTANISFTEKNFSDNAVTLPLSAIYQTGKIQQVWLVKDGKVELKSVETVALNENSVKVRGLNDGDIVVTAGVHKLHEGQEVRLK